MIAALEAVNPSTVPARSPFRYPGGKTWFVPIFKKWLSARAHMPSELVEPFAGGAIVGLSAAIENLVPLSTLVELDPNVASVWQTILLGDGRAFAERIAAFGVTPEAVAALAGEAAPTLADLAFSVLIRNRISRGGIMAPGAGIMKAGENGKGMTSRWYPETLRRRIMDIVEAAGRIRFIEGNGVSVIAANAHRPDVVWFIDPPYTKAGKRLYTMSNLDHADLFDRASRLAGDFLMTYDETAEIHSLCVRHGFQTRRVRMKTTHHDQKFELIIGRELGALDS